MYLMKNGTFLRSATGEDIVSIEYCATSAYDKYVERLGRKPAPMVADFENLVSQGRVVVACNNKRLVGFVVFYPVMDVIHLENVAVLPAMSGQGVGKMLIAHVEDAASKQGYCSVELYTNEVMTENLHIYPSLGYREIDRRTEDGFNRVYFMKKVSADK